MKQAFLPVKLSSQKLEMLKIIQDIVEEYQAMGYKLPSGSCIYQLVSRDIIPTKTLNIKNSVLY